MVSIFKYVCWNCSWLGHVIVVLFCYILWLIIIDWSLCFPLSCRSYPVSYPYTLIPEPSHSSVPMSTTRPKATSLAMVRHPDHMRPAQHGRHWDQQLQASCEDHPAMSGQAASEKLFDMPLVRNRQGHVKERWKHHVDQVEFIKYSDIIPFDYNLSVMCLAVV